MNLNFIDWVIVLLVLVGMFYSVSLTSGLMKSVSDFLSAGRTGGRYIMAISGGVAGVGAISIVMYLEMGYVSGFALSWWGLSQGLIILLIQVSGWVSYRFRQTRCLTLAEFFEKRYSRKFRIFAGIELQPMHRSDKGPKIVPPLFGFRSPFGHPGLQNSLLEGRPSPHLKTSGFQDCRILGTPAGAGDGGRSPPQFRIQDS